MWNDKKLAQMADESEKERGLLEKYLEMSNKIHILSTIFEMH